MTERQCDNCGHHPARQPCPCGCIILVCDGCHQTITAVHERINRMFKQ